LDLPVLSYVASIEQISNDSLIAERLIEEGYQRVRSPLPVLLTVVKEIAEPRLPTLKGKKRAMAAEIISWGASDLDTDPTFLGLKGSPTRVVKIETPKVSRQCRMVKVEDDASLHEAVDQLFTFLEERDLLGGRHA
jgi:electron transfer flavoprotein beta subunit